MLHMNGGNGEASYATNSLIQRNVISLTRPIREHAINEAYINTFPRTFCMADMGCSSGPNTLLVISEAVDTIYKTCQKLLRKTPEIQFHMNDLPSNDFNSIFNSLPSFEAEIRGRIKTGSRPCFINGVPGSFFGRLFPSRSLHFVHSSYSLHWLSQVPKGIECNGRDIYVSKCSPPSVLRAYHEQFEADFSSFLKCRSEEIVEGGRMVLTFNGRISDDYTSKDFTPIWDMLAMSLNEMVIDGLIDEEKIHKFNIPQYRPCPAEISSVVNEEGSFTVDQLHVSNVNWCASKEECSSSDSSQEDGYNFSKSIRAVVEPLLATMFETSLLEEIFQRYEKKIVEHMMKEVTQFTNVTVSLSRVN